MDVIEFNNCRVFLEKLIDKEPTNSDLINAYVKLIEQRTKFNISWFQSGEELQKDFQKNQTERLKTQK